VSRVAGHSHLSSHGSAQYETRLTSTFHWAQLGLRTPVEGTSRCAFACYHMHTPHNRLTADWRASTVGKPFGTGHQSTSYRAIMTELVAESNFSCTLTALPRSPLSSGYHVGGVAHGGLPVLRLAIGIYSVFRGLSYTLPSTCGLCRRVSVRNL